MVDADTTVTATFAAKAKPPKCVVPQAKGKTLAVAKRAIKSHDCSVGRVTRRTSRKSRKAT
jgi:beta-lactam-binding protein with PASTA domain